MYNPLQSHSFHRATFPAPTPALSRHARFIRMSCLLCEWAYSTWLPSCRLDRSASLDCPDRPVSLDCLPVARIPVSLDCLPVARIPVSPDCLPVAQIGLFYTIACLFSGSRPALCQPVHTLDNPRFPRRCAIPCKATLSTGPPSPRQAEGESHNPNKKQPPQRMNVSVHPLRGFSIAVCCLSGDFLNLSDFHSRPANRPPASLSRKALPERAVAPANPREAHLSGVLPWAFRGREGCTFSRSILHT